MTLALFALAPWIAEAREPAGSTHQGNDMTLRLEILALDTERQVGVFRRRVGRHGGDPSGFDRSPCRYPGLKAEHEGVELGIYDLELGKTVESWWIYAPARDEAGCTSHEEASAQLTLAKASFAKLRLDISEPPKRQTLEELGLDKRVFQPPSLPPEARSSDHFDNLVAGHRTGLWLGDVRIHALLVFEPAFDEKGDITAGYRAGPYVVVVECASREPGPSYASRRSCGLSPLLPVPLR